MRSKLVLTLSMIIVFAVPAVHAGSLTLSGGTLSDGTGTDQSVAISKTGYTTASGIGYTIFALTGMGATTSLPIALGQQANVQTSGLETGNYGVADGYCPQCGLGLIGSTTSTGLVVDYASVTVGSNFVIKITDLDTTSDSNLKNGDNKILPDLLVFDTNGTIIDAYNYSALAGVMSQPSGAGGEGEWDINLGGLISGQTIGGYILYADDSSIGQPGGGLNQGHNDPYFLLSSAPIPEPTTLVLLGSALALCACARILKRQ